MIEEKLAKEANDKNQKSGKRLKFKTGRPPAYKTVEEMEIKIQEYFDTTDIEDYTITGLSLHLGFAERKSLIDYSGKPEFVHTIKVAKQMIEHSYEVDLKKKGNTGTIFALKNFDWVDKQEIKSDNTNRNLNTELTPEKLKAMTPQELSEAQKSLL